MDAEKGFSQKNIKNDMIWALLVTSQQQRYFDIQQLQKNIHD